MSTSDDAISLLNMNQYQYNMVQKVQGRRKNNSNSFSSNDENSREHITYENIKPNKSGNGLKLLHSSDAATATEETNAITVRNYSNTKGKRINIVI